MPLCDWHDWAGFKAGQFALVFCGLVRRRGQLLLDIGQALLVVGFVAQQRECLLQHGLQGFLVCFWQFSVGNFVEVLLYRLGRRGLSGLECANRKAQAEPCGDE